MDEVKKKKAFSLRLLQIAWVIEVAAIIGYTMVAVPLAETVRLGLWLQALPLLTALVGTQGIIAGGGPLLADKLKNGHKEM